MSSAKKLTVAANVKAAAKPAVFFLLKVLKNIANIYTFKIN